MAADTQGSQQTSFGQRDFSSGQANNLNPTIAPDNSCRLVLNMDCDEEIGSAVTRLGSIRLGSQLVASKVILGIHQFVDAVNSANNILLAALNASGDATATIKNVATGSDVVTGLTAGRKVRFLSFLGETLAINGVDAERAFTGSSWITTGGAFDLGDIPGNNTCDLAIEFLDRVYLGGDDSNPDRVHFSTISNGSAISWSGDYIDVEPEDGGGRLTAFGKVPGYILLFKERSLKRFNAQSAFPESLVQIGTPHQECVVMGGGLCAFFSSSGENERGFYVTNGGRPIPISHDTNRPIKKWVDAIPKASEAAIAGYATDRSFCWSVGDLLVDGVQYKNVHLRYNRILNQWTVRTYPTGHRMFGKYLVSGTDTVVAGDNDGNVIRIDTAGTFTDAPSATTVPYVVETQETTYNISTLKRVSDRVVVRGVNLGTPTVSVIADGELKQAKKVDGITRLFLRLFGIGDVEGTYISYRVAGMAPKGGRTTIREIEPTKITALGNYA